MVVLCLLVLLLSASSCKDPRVDRVTIDSGDITLAVGETRTLTATADAQFGANPAIEWVSANAGVATVTSGGVVQGVAVGATAIVAKSVFDPSKRDEILATVVASSAQRSLTVERAGSGTGTVTSTPAGVDCGASCMAPFDDGTTVTLTATAAAGSSFVGWGGACSGTSSTCTVSMTTARTVTAAFALVASDSQTLLVTRLGSGAGSVVSSPTGIDCGGTCAAEFAQGTSVTLTATAASGSVFSGWGGACSGTSSTCTVSMTELRAVTATFTSQTHTLVVTRAGAAFGSGTVTSSPAGIDCGATCSAQFAQGTSVTLTASAAANAMFTGWSGACTGSAPTCTVSMTQARDVTATFLLVGTPMFALSVTRAGEGSGTVTSSPAGIDCGSACSSMFAQGTSVTLTASAAFGQLFSGWSGACTGTATTCTVSMTEARSVTATFGQVVISIRPPNDDFANSALLTGTSGSTTGHNRFATKEANEPPHAYTRDAWNEGGKSVWWHWVAPNTGGVVFDTIGSSFDTMLGVYTGSALNQLTSVGYNDDRAFGAPQSRVVVPVIGGVTYRIAVDGFGSAVTVSEGDIVLNWGYVTSPEGPPLNDNFAFGFVMRGSSGRTTGTNMLATKESGEPNHWTSVAASVWWHWTAPSTGSVTISTAGSTFDTVLAVYTGSPVNGLTLIARNDDAGVGQSRVTFTANGGTTYRIAVDGFRAVTGVVATGIISLNWAQ